MSKLEEYSGNTSEKGNPLPLKAQSGRYASTACAAVKSGGARKHVPREKRTRSKAYIHNGIRRFWKRGKVKYTARELKSLGKGLNQRTDRKDRKATLETCACASPHERRGKRKVSMPTDRRSMPRAITFCGHGPAAQKESQKTGSGNPN